MDLKERDESDGIATRRRGKALESAILQAAWDVLAEDGYSGFTFEAIAARAGTSRPVLYRRWPARDDLLLATLQEFWWSSPIPVPDTGSLRQDALDYLEAANETRAWLTTLISVQLADYFRHSGMTFRQLRDRMRPEGAPNSLEIMLGRAVARGELRGIPSSQRVIDLLFDLFRHELLMSMRTVPASTIRGIVDDVWLPLLAVTDVRPDHAGS
ncbi:TetR/AcrR family transcriptional regulator [Cnuibacter sp. UC19_7]|uniref:TetR/AcrR family transcriptional regulator n=1 Tax=Cnuibacter sp. UC19_7 TaxID=3350166 RepID=UPI00366F0F6B